MEFSIKRINALCIKEFRDLKKNINVSIMWIFPLLLSFLYSSFNKGQMGEDTFLSMTLNMNCSMIASLIMAMMISEEKEKNTLRTLMLSGISPMEFLAGKAIITFVISTIINILVFVIGGISHKYFIPFLIVGLILLISMIILGAVIGIISKNQMETGTLGIPIIAIFFMLPNLAAANKTIKSIANFLPTYHSNLLIKNMFKGDSLLNGKFHFLVLFVWIIIACLVFAYIYKKKMLDN